MPLDAPMAMVECLHGSYIWGSGRRGYTRLPA